MEKSNVRKYVFWLVFFVLLVMFFAVVVIMGDDSGNHWRFLAEVVGLGLALNLVASVLIVIFFEQRDTRAKSGRERKVAHKIALEIRKFLKALPGGEKIIGDKISVEQLREKSGKVDLEVVYELFRRIEYLHDMFHGEIDERLAGEIDMMLLLGDELREKCGKEEKIAIAELPLEEIKVMVDTIESRYGLGVFGG